MKKEKMSTLSTDANTSGAKVMVTGVSFNMIKIPAGEFLMGSPASESGRDNDDEDPLHRVRISAFQMGEAEVTQGLWKAVMGNNPSKFKGSKNPVEMVSWNYAQEFTRKLNILVSGAEFRLPAEAGWELSFRFGDKSYRTFLGFQPVGSWR